MKNREDLGMKIVENIKMKTKSVERGRSKGCGLAYLAAAALAVALATGSWTGAAAATAAKDITIALVLNDLTNPVSLPLRKGAEDAAAELGFKLITVGPSPSTAQGQIALLETMETQGAKGVVLLPVDSEALVPAIDATVAGGIPVVTTELDAPTSKRSFFFFGGANPVDQGKFSADRVFQHFKDAGAKGTINFVITSCLPTVTGQQDRMNGFVNRVAELNKGSPFQLQQVGFYNTTTDPAKNFANTQNIYTAEGGKIGLAYAMCGPDTQNWGQVLKQNNDHNIVVAGYDWLPATLDLIEEGWIAWAQGSSLYQEGNHTTKVLFDHLANGTALPTGAQNGDAVWADKSNIADVRNSPDVKMAK
jgi:ABC-type sugar transport system substrate-binding protein